MRSSSRSRWLVVGLIVVMACGLVVVLLVSLTSGSAATVSVSDLTQMKTLVHEYLNERNRVYVSQDPQNNPNIAGAPVIAPSEMSPGLAARQKEDVDKLIAKKYPPFWDDFATYAGVVDIRKDGDKTVLDIKDVTFYHFAQATNNPQFHPRYSGEGDEYYFTFSKKGNRWILDDVQLPYAADSMPPGIEPSVQPGESGTARVTAKRPKLIETVPVKIQRLDEAATRQIKNKWVLDKKESESAYYNVD